MGSKFNEARIWDYMNLREIANVSVIQPAISTVLLAKPKKRLNIILGTLLGAAPDLGLACFYYHTSSQFIQFPPLKDQRNDLAVKFYDICIETNQLVRCYSGAE